MLDTESCLWLLQEREPVLSRVRAMAPDDLAISAMTEAELRYGARTSRDPAAGLARIEAFLSAPIELMPFDSDAAGCHDELRWALRSRPISAGEGALISASIAMARRAVFVTRSRRELEGVPRLVPEDWTIA